MSQKKKICEMQVKLLIKGFQELGILEKGKSIQYNYLNPTAIGMSHHLAAHLFSRFGLECILWWYRGVRGDQNLT
jgi:hypothetical protein